MRTHGAVVGRRFRSVTKLTAKVRTGVRGYLWVSFLIAAAALKTPTRNGYNAQGVNLKFFCEFFRIDLTVAVFGKKNSWWHPLLKNLLRLEAGYPALRCHILEEEPHAPLSDLK